MNENARRGGERVPSNGGVVDSVDKRGADGKRVSRQSASSTRKSSNQTPFTRMLPETFADRPVRDARCNGLGAGHRRLNERQLTENVFHP